MSYGLSIDVGTSYTAAAVLPAGGSGAEPRVLPLGSRGASVPTVVFLAEDGTRLVGEVAERRGFAEPGRVAREFKRRMGDSVPLVLGESAVLPEELFVVVVAWVVGVATEREGEPPASITLTHPAGWGEHRTSLLRQALAEAGFHDVVLMTEPEAAALSYASRERVVPGSTLAVYDLGGGTFDATVVRKTGADTFTILGAPQGIERLGGADFDQEVFARVLENSEAAPADLEQSSPEVLAALTRLRRECAEAKEALSSDSEATVSVMVPGSHTQVRLVRSEFELMVEPALRETVDTMRAALDSADVRPEDLSAILLVGGSSRIPLVAQLLSAEFNRPLAIDLDPKASVALGAAFATVALEAAGDAEGAADQQEAAEPATAPGPLRSGVNAAGFAIPSHKGAAEPHHGPVTMASNKRLGVRVAAIAAAVALLGVATATATNAPSLRAFGERADAAQPTSPAATGKPSAAPSQAPGLGVGPLRDAGAAGEPDGVPTLMDQVLGAGQGSASASPSAAGTPSRSADATKRPSAKASDDAGKDAVTPEATPGSTQPGGAAPAPSPSAGPQSGATTDPGTSPVQPTPPVPFPSADPTPTPTDPPTAPVPPTTPPVVVPTPTPTTPAPSPDPTVDPTTPPPTTPPPSDPPPTDPTPSDPPPSDPSPSNPPPTQPASEPTSTPADPTPTDPPAAATEPATAVN